MRPRTILRFAVWTLAVIGALVFHAHLLIALTSLLVIFGLLCTTPADAIRLPRGISEIFILLSTLTISHQLAAWPLVMHMGILLLMMILMRLWGQSPWWAVLYGWFPV